MKRVTNTRGIVTPAIYICDHTCAINVLFNRNKLTGKICRIQSSESQSSTYVSTSVRRLTCCWFVSCIINTLYSLTILGKS